MFRRMIVAAVVAASIGFAAAQAAERATVVLTDGSRQSGEVVFHGSGSRNIIDNYLNLGEGGKEKGVPVDQVVLIDFGGGEPTAADFQQMPGNDDHLLVLRGGGSQRGRLVNLTHGTTVEWRNEAGQAQQYAIRDVARIYLNGSAARRLYPQFANVAPAAVGTAGSDAADAPEARNTIRVAANQAWTPTGVRVAKGQRLVFTATGQVQFSREAAHTAGPDGNPSLQTPGVPVPAMPVGGLIGRIGNGEPFPIGSNREPITMPAMGQLQLGINDTDVSDNSGHFSVGLSSGGRRR